MSTETPAPTPAPAEDFTSLGITKEFLEEALNKKWGSSLDPGKKLQVEKFTVSKGSVVGDGYTTILVSVDVWLQNHQDFVHFQSDWFRTVDGGKVETPKIKSNEPAGPLSFVIKCFPENVARQEFLEATDIFSTELGVYEKVTPDLLKFQEDLNLPKILKPAFPPLIAGRALTVAEMKKLKETRPLKPLDNFIMMMDIRKHGNFQLLDRFLGFDLDHYKLVVEAHAQIHAIAWAYKQKQKIPALRAIYPFLQMPLMMDNIAMMEQMITGHIDIARSVVTHGMGGNEQILKGLDQLTVDGKSLQIFGLYYDYDAKFDPNAPQQKKEETAVTDEPIDGGGAASPKIFTKDSILRIHGETVENEEPWLTLIHGDAWSNNMMFRYDEATGKPVQVIILDLQICREGDPMADLNYAIYSGTTSEFRAKHLDSMLHVYFDKFSEICRHFSVSPLPNFTRTELKRRFHRAKAFGLISGIILLPIILKNPDLLVDMETMPVSGEGKDQDGVSGQDEKVNVTQIDEGKTPEQLDMDKKMESMKGFMEMLGRDSDYEKLHPIMRQRISGLLQDMTDQGVL